MNTPVDTKPGEGVRGIPSKVRTGTVAIAILGWVFCVTPVLAGSLATWRADRVLGLYSGTGMEFGYFTGGDGNITLGIAVFLLLMFPAGALAGCKIFYAAALVASILCLSLSVWELVYLFSLHGVISPGVGLYLVIGGSLIGAFCSAAGYLMLNEITDRS